MNITVDSFSVIMQEKQIGIENNKKEYCQAIYYYYDEINKRKYKNARGTK